MKYKFFSFSLLLLLIISCSSSKKHSRFSAHRSVEAVPLSLQPLQSSLSKELVYSKNVPLVAPFRVPQSFDFDSKGNIYYSQIGRASGFEQGKTKAHELYIIKSTPNEPGTTSYMTLRYFGHGSQMAIEEDNGEIYVWIGSNATKYPSGEYWDSQSVSRIKFEAGKTYEGCGGDNFFLNNGVLRNYAAINKEANLICINATDRGTRYFYTYKLSDVMAAPLKDFTFSVTVGGEELHSRKEVVERRVEGRDLSGLTPLGWFAIPPGANKATDINSYHFQGYDIDQYGFIYFFEGDGYNIHNTGLPSQAYVTVYNHNGKIVRERTGVKAIELAEQLMQMGLTNTSGYMEGEGIKIKGDKIYLQFASHMEPDNRRRANIFEYSSHR